MMAQLTNHLWQSTLFAAAAGLVTLAFRKNRAQVRYWLWFSASLKFLVPFALLITLGSQLEWPAAARKVAAQIVTPAVSYTVTELSQPFSPPSQPAPPAPHTRDWVTPALFGLWACGFAAIALVRLRGWLRIRAAVRASTAGQLADLPHGVTVRFCPGLTEPGLVGLWHPILLLPAGIHERLTPRQMEAVLVHELCHVRRRDNLTSTVHMIVEALFWFHPLVWWISARLVAERERACDEAVLQSGSEPQVYAEGILTVCKTYLESPLLCVSGVTGSDLKKRIQAILTGHVAGELNAARKAALAVAAMVALAAPVVVGMMNAPAIRAQAQPVPQALPAQQSSQSTRGASAGQLPTVTQTLRSPSRPADGPAPASDYLSAVGTVTADSVTIRPRVDGQLMSVNVKEGDTVRAGQLLATIDPRTYQIEVVQAEGRLDQDRTALANARENVESYRKSVQLGSAPQPQLDAAIAEEGQIEGKLKIDQAGLDGAKLQLSYTQISAPIAGVVGLRLIDPGNMVHATDTTGIMIINQLQPIAVVFAIPEENVPQVLARLKEGASPPVEAWDRTNTARIATGRLTAVDNQIDLQTGTAKLKATFDNKDGALFPNQFVNVRLRLKGQ